MISVIVPVYNVGEYFDNCIKSIINQTYKDIEIILVDDGSTDGSGEKCDYYSKLDDRIRVIHTLNRGASSARNIGLNNAQGEYIGFIDADDYIDKNMYKILLHFLKKYNVKISHIQAIEISRYNEIDTLKNEKQFEVYLRDKYSTLKRMLLHKEDVSFCTRLFHCSCFKNVKFKNGYSNEDFELMIRMIQFKQFEVYCDINKNMYGYMRRENSISKGYSKAIIDSIPNSLRALEMVRKDFPQYTELGIRFCFVQRLVFMQLIPIDKMNKKNHDYINVIKWMRINFIKGMKNKYLPLHEKRNIIAYILMPRAAKKIYKCLRRIKNNIHEKVNF